MLEINIKKASIEDLSIIQNFNNELFKLEKENFDPTLVVDWPLSSDGKEYFEDLINNHYVIVAVIEQEIVGYLAGTINEKGSYEEVQYGEICNMLVSDKCRGYGVGKKLINSFKEHCRKNNIYNLKVVASAKNINAINFYKSNGFQEFNLTLTTKLDNEE